VRRRSGAWRPDQPHAADGHDPENQIAARPPAPRSSCRGQRPAGPAGGPLVRRRLCRPTA